MNEHPAVNPSSMTPVVLAQVLHRASGESITVELIQQHLEEGAPTDADG